MIMRFIGARVGQAIEPCRLGMRVLPRCMVMRIAAMDQLTVLGAAGMLNEEHVTATQTLENDRQYACQDTSAPNH